MLGFLTVLEGPKELEEPEEPVELEKLEELQGPN